MIADLAVVDETAARRELVGRGVPFIDTVDMPDASVE
jgi:hypothetical protein